MCAWEQVLLIYGTVYLVFMFIYHGASTEWVYSVLDWDKPASLGLYVFLPLALFISFVIWCASSWQSHRRMPPTVLQVASWLVGVESGYLCTSLVVIFSEETRGRAAVSNKHDFGECL